MADIPNPAAARRAGSTTLVLTTGGCVLAIVGVFLVSGWMSYFEGLANGRRGMQLMLYFLVGGLLWLVGTSVSIARIFVSWSRDRAHVRTPFAGFCLCLLAAAIGFATAPGSNAFDRGFDRWVTASTDVPAIDAWTQSLTPTTTPSVAVLHEGDPPDPTESLPPTWPLAITVMNPTRVTRLSTGVMLEWGSFGTWGDCRRVFVANDDAFDPNTLEWSEHFGFRQLRPRLWAAVQYTY